MVLKFLGALTVIDVRTGGHRFLPAESSQLPTSLPGTAASLTPWHPQRPLRILQRSPLSQMPQHPAVDEVRRDTCRYIVIWKGK